MFDRITRALKVNNRSTRNRCEICSKLTSINVIEVILLFLLLTLSDFKRISHLSSVSIVGFEEVNVSWVFVLLIKDTL